jgi:isopenicillin N synthase-like dioxygenase
MPTASFTEIPLIDLSPLLEGTEAGLRHIARKIDAAYSTVGFSYLTHHGLPDALIQGVFQASASFHALPREAKMKIEINEFHHEKRARMK